jgi:hypothetical protein
VDSPRDTLVRQAKLFGTVLPDARPGAFERCSDYELAGAIDAYANEGLADAVSGSTDAPCGYFARIDSWVLRTDSDGFHTLHECEDVAQAVALFTALEQQYELWNNAEAN